MGYREALEQLLLIVIPGILLALINVFGGKSKAGKVDFSKSDSRERR
jgi:hypothetical protein